MMNPVPWLQMTNMISYQGLVRTFLRQPPCRNKQCSDDTPRDKRADIWHHHVAEETTKALNFDLEIG